MYIVLYCYRKYKKWLKKVWKNMAPHGRRYRIIVPTCKQALHNIQLGVFKTKVVYMYFQYGGSWKFCGCEIWTCEEATSHQKRCWTCYSVYRRGKPWIIIRISYLCHFVNSSCTGIPFLNMSGHNELIILQELQNIIQCQPVAKCNSGVSINKIRKNCHFFTRCSR